MAAEYLREIKEQEKEEASSPTRYLIKELSYMECLLEIISLELKRIERAEIDHEVVLVKEESGKHRLFDFMTGAVKDIPIFTKEEFKEYINQRAGMKVY